jgi:hypothetical protein
MDAAITFMNNNQLSYFKSAAEVIFERMAHAKVSANGLSVFRRCPDRRINLPKDKALIKTNQEQFGVSASTKIGPLKFEPKFPVYFSDLNNLTLSKRSAFGKYFEPNIKNFESIDSFSIINYEAFLFQLTNAQRHPVRAAGLEAFVDFVERNWPEDKARFTYHLVFVFPESEKASKTFTAQAILGANGENMVDVPDKLKPFLFNQWICELKMLDSVNEVISRRNKV